MVGKPVSLFSSRCSPCYIFFVRLHNCHYQVFAQQVLQDARDFSLGLCYNKSTSRLCWCSPSLGSCHVGDTWLHLRPGVCVRAENRVVLSLECLEPLKGICNGFGCTASFPKENEMTAPRQLFLWKNNLQRVRNSPSSYAESLCECNGRH